MIASLALFNYPQAAISPVTNFLSIDSNHNTLYRGYTQCHNCLSVLIRAQNLRNLTSSGKESQKNHNRQAEVQLQHQHSTQNRYFFIIFIIAQMTYMICYCIKGNRYRVIKMVEMAKGNLIVSTRLEWWLHD